MRHGNDTLTVDFDDPVSDTHAAPLGNATSHQAADLRRDTAKMGDLSNVATF